MDNPTLKESLVTVADLMALGSDARVEIVDGEIVEMSPVGGTHHFVAGNIFRWLDRLALQHGSGYAIMDGLIYLLSKQGLGLRGARVPDVSYIRKQDIPADWDMDHPFPGAPTLAVEVMSPDDKSEDVIIRVRDYLNAGTQQVWVIYPASKEVYQYRRDDLSTVHVYAGEMAVDASEFFPDGRLALMDIFSLPDLKG